MVTKRTNSQYMFVVMRMSVHMCRGHTCVCVYIHKHMCSCVWKPHVIFLNCFPPIYGVSISHLLRPETNLASVASQIALGISSVCLYAGVTGRPSCLPKLYVDAGHANHSSSYSHVRILPTYPSLQLSRCILKEMLLKINNNNKK